jgi:hypothetical protein
MFRAFFLFFEYSIFFLFLEYRILSRVEDSRRRTREGVEVWADGWEGKTKGFIEPKGSRARGGCGFSSLMKQKIKGKNCAVFCFAGFFFKKNLS